MAKGKAKQTHAKKTDQAAAPASTPPAQNTSATNQSLSATTALKSRVQQVLGTLSPMWTAVTPAQRTSFLARYSDTKCEALGGRTKSGGVLSDAIGWAPIMSKALKANATALKRYGAIRFAWFLECIGLLADARAAQAATGDTVVEATTQVTIAKQAAISARAELLETLEELVDGLDSDEAHLSKETGLIDTPDNIVLSIGSLAKYARGWVARKDSQSHELVQSVGLTLSEIETAEKAAGALATATAEKTIEGRVTPNDTPAVNRVEGRLLNEMKAAMRVFARANAKNGEIPKLVPGDATRSVLSPRPGKAPEPAPAPVPAPAAAPKT